MARVELPCHHTNYQHPQHLSVPFPFPAAQLKPSAGAVRTDQGGRYGLALPEEAASIMPSVRQVRVLFLVQRNKQKTAHVASVLQLATPTPEPTGVCWFESGKVHRPFFLSSFSAECTCAITQTSMKVAPLPGGGGF